MDHVCGRCAVGLVAHAIKLQVYSPKEALVDLCRELDELHDVDSAPDASADIAVRSARNWVQARWRDHPATAVRVIRPVAITLGEGIRIQCGGARHHHRDGERQLPHAGVRQAGS